MYETNCAYNLVDLTIKGTTNKTKRQSQGVSFLSTRNLVATVVVDVHALDD